MEETYRVVQIEQLDGVKMRTTLAENLSKETASRTVATCSAELADVHNPGAIIFKAEPEEPPTADGTIKIGVTIQLGGSEAEDICGFHDEARERYSKWTATLVERTKEYGQTRSQIEFHEWKMGTIESKWIAAGLLKECKNDLERKATLINARESDEKYAEQDSAMSALKSDLACIVEPGLEEAKYLRRLAEEDLKWCSSVLGTLTGLVNGDRDGR